MPSTVRTVAALAVGVLAGALLASAALGGVPVAPSDDSPQQSFRYSARSGCLDQVPDDPVEVTREREADHVAVEVGSRFEYAHGQTFYADLFRQHRTYVVVLDPMPNPSHGTHDGCPYATNVDARAEVDPGYHCIRVTYNGTTLATYRNESVEDPCSW